MDFAFGFELSGFPAILFFFGVLYVFVYLPLKFVTKGLGKGKATVEKKTRLATQTIVAEYAPPEGITPAELGYLLDTKIREDEVFAAIITLSQQGVIKLTDNEKGIIVLGIDTSLGHLSRFEKYLCQRLESRVGGQPLSLGYLKSLARYYGADLYDDLQEKGFLFTRRDFIKQAGARVALIWLLLVLLFPYAVVRPRTIEHIVNWGIFALAASPIYIITSSFLYIQFAKEAGQNWLATQKLKALWPQIEGYRQYLMMVEEIIWLLSQAKRKL